VIDKSGSMSEELDDLRTALHAMTDQLQPDDRVAIITYGTFAKVLMSPTLADDPDKIHRKIDRIKAGGSTAMEGGLRLGYDTIDRFETADVESRVMLFTDVQPNVGATESTEFEDIVRDGAEQGIHLTLFGLGYQFGHGLALDISDLRGGNYYSLPDGSTAIDLFEDEFEFMVTPLAFDLQMRVDSPYGYVDGYNIQGSTVGVGATVDVSVSTIFLSRRHGASILRLELPDEAIPAGTEVASLQLAYEDAHTAATVEDDFTVSFPSAGEGLEGDLFEQPGTRKATALVNMGLGMIALCEGSDSTGTEGVASAYWEMRDRLATEAEVLGDQALADEVALVDKLAENAGLVLEQ